MKEAEFKVAEAAPSAEHDGAEVVAANMRLRVPVRTGRLRASIHAEGGSAVADVSYAVPVDRGTIYMRAQPYAEAAARASYGGIEASMIARFRKALGGR